MALITLFGADGIHKILPPLFFELTTALLVCSPLSPATTNSFVWISTGSIFSRMLYLNEQYFRSLKTNRYLLYTQRIISVGYSEPPTRASFTTICWRGKLLVVRIFRCKNLHFEIYEYLGSLYSNESLMVQKTGLKTPMFVLV